MGDQPKPVEDEVERALSSMRASFLSASEQIATGIASLDEHFASAPEAERTAVATAVARLVATHERLTTRVAELPPSSWDSFKIMVGAVKAQQAVLDQVSHLVQEHVLPRQLESLAATPFPAASVDDDPPPPVSASFIPSDVGGFPGPEGSHRDVRPLFGEGGVLSRDSGHGNDPLFADGGVAGHDGPRGDVPPLFGEGGVLSRDDSRPDDGGFDGGFQDGSGYHGDESVRAPLEPGFADPPAVAVHRGARRSGTAGRRRRDPPGFRALTEAGLRRTDDETADEPGRRSLFATMRERMAGFSGLAAMAVVGVILSLFPREMQLQEIAGRLVEMVKPAGDATVAADTSSTAVAATEPRTMERVPATPEGNPAAGGEPPAAGPSPERRSAGASRRAQAEGSRREAAAPAQAEVKAERVAAAQAVAPPVKPPARKRFVPVVFTHKDKATALRAMADLRAQYPNILIGRRGEAVPVDLGAKGIWHRLVILPAGPRSEATKLCDELAEEGYDLCWVNDY